MKIYTPDGRCNISGERIRKARVSQGITQEQLAAKIQCEGLDISQRTISRIETGLRVVADYELEYIAKALNVSVLYLLEMETSPPGFKGR